jgi:hypothetical protein
MSSYGNLQPLPQAGAFFRLPLISAAGDVRAPLLSDSRPGAAGVAEPASELRAMANEVAAIAQQTSQRQSTRRQPGNAPGVNPGSPLFIR